MANWVAGDQDRRDRLMAEEDRLQTALYVNYAVNSPEALNRAMQRHHLSLLRSHHQGPLVSESVTDALATMEAAFRRGPILPS